MIVAAILARDEAARLPRTLDRLAPFVDATVVVDDGSTDDTAALAHAAGADVTALPPTHAGWWSAAHPEAPKRAVLWDVAAARAGPGGWVLVCDADMELVGLSPQDLRLLTDPAILVNAWSWVLWDAWNDEGRARADGYWQAHTRPRVWLARVPTEPFAPRWERDALHVGHFPSNLSLTAGVVPPPAGYRHLAYLRPEDRVRKAAAYRAA